MSSSNRLGADGLNFAVLRLRNGEVLYNGPSLFDAAVMFVPGTCSGKADNEANALLDAQINRANILAASF